MKVSVCVIAKMENLYIREFVEYYKALGFDKIYLYDNNDVNGEKFDDVIGDYINDSFVDVTNYRGLTVCQTKAYQDCYEKHSNDCDWLLYCDVDEFLRIVDEGVNDISSFVSQDKFKDYGIIVLNWLCYGDNGLVRYDKRKLNERFTKHIYPITFEKGYKFPENFHIKSLIRTKQEVQWIGGTPHIPFKNNLKACNAEGVECKNTSPFNVFSYKSAYLKHFVTKTIEEFILIKARRGYPDGKKDFFKTNSILKDFYGWKGNEVTEEKNEVAKMLLDRLGIENPDDMAILSKTDSKMNPKIIVSMTTIPCRKERLLENLPAILGQSYNFDKLVINVDDNLSDEDYAFYDSLKEKDERIEIGKGESKWRSCNKLLPTITKYPDDIIITVDDDIYYPIDCVKLLVEEWQNNKDCIIAHEINPIEVSKDYTYVTYKNAYDVMMKQKEFGKYMSNCCLFPPHVFDGSDLFDFDKMIECTEGTHDELWFWVNSTINGVMCIGLNYVRTFAYDTKSPYKAEEYQLTNINVSAKKIAEYMYKINKMYGDRLMKNIKEKNVIFHLKNEDVYTFSLLMPYIKDTYWYADVDVSNLTRSWRSKALNIIKGKELGI